MNGPEHYAKAERILGEVDRELGYELDSDHPWVASSLARAQVHATLALAAATALPAIYSDGSATERLRAWARVSP